MLLSGSTKYMCDLTKKERRTEYEPMILARSGACRGEEDGVDDSREALRCSHCVTNTLKTGVAGSCFGTVVSTDADLDL